MNTLEIPDRGLLEGVVRVRIERGQNRFHVKAGVSSRARVLIEELPPEGPEETSLEFDLDQGACVDVFFVPGKDRKAAARCEYRLKKHASLNVWTLVVSDAEISHEVKFLEPHGFASVRGLSVLDKRSRAVHRVTAGHRTGHCISRQFYKSVLSGEALSEFDSLVEVDKGADGSDSKQLNKNLLLSKTAKARSRPELRIHADEVACAHGSATGQLDENELFYLESRGISVGTARFMITEGFAEEVLDGVSDPDLKRTLEGLVREKVGRMVSA